MTAAFDRAHRMLTDAGLPGHTADTLLADVPTGGLACLAAMSTTIVDPVGYLASLDVDHLAAVLQTPEQRGVAVRFLQTCQAVT